MEEIFHPSSKFTKSYYSSGRFKLDGIDIETPTFSCSGATSWLAWQGGTLSDLIVTIKVNGISIGNPKTFYDWYTIASEDPNIPFDISASSNGYRVTLSSKESVTQTIRVEFILSESWNFFDFLPSEEFYNPTLTTYLNDVEIVQKSGNIDRFTFCLAPEQEVPNNLPYVAVYTKIINPSPTVPLQSYSITKNGISDGIIPTTFMPYVIPNTLQALPSDNVDINLAFLFQVWDNSTKGYFFNNSPDENEYEIVLLPANQDQVSMEFWRDGIALGTNVTLGMNNVDDISLVGTSYTSTGGSSWGNNTVTGQAYCLTMDVNIEGVIQTQTQTVTGQNELMANIFSRLTQAAGFYKTRPTTPPSSWNNYYSGFDVETDSGLVYGKNLSYPPAAQGGAVINPEDRMNATLTFKPTTPLPANTIDIYSMLTNVSGPNVVSTRGLIFSGTVSI